MLLLQTSSRDEKIIQKARDNIGENEKIREQTLLMISEWIQKQPHLSSLATERDHLLYFLRTCKYRNEEIKRKIDVYMSMRAAIPEYFCGLNPYKPELQAALELGTFLPLLGRDQLCRRVILMRPASFDPFLYKAADTDKANYMVAEVLAKLDPTLFITGVVIVIDMETATIQHLNQRSFPMVKKFMRYFTDALPIRLQALHIIGMPSSLNTAYNFVSGFTSDKIKKRFRIHKSDLKSLYKEVPRSILPAEYGGDDGSISKFTEFWKEKVEEHQEYLARIESVTRSDESKRPGKPKRSQELFGMEGSFRKLDID